MKNLLRFGTAICVLCAPFAPRQAIGAITSVTQTGSNLDPIAPIIETALFGEEAFAYVDRTHELTSARYNPATGLLTTDAATGVLAGFPPYLIGLRYVSNANDNRAAGAVGDSASYRVTYNVDTPSFAYLFLDNRLNGAGGNWSNPNTSDPNLGGSLAWVPSDGWTRVNTGLMPNGQGDYLGIDEGGTVAGPDVRTHHDPGPGVGLNNFFAIYRKEVSGSFDTLAIRQAAGNGNMYVVAVTPIPEPGALTLIAGGLVALAAWASRRRG